MTNAAIKSLFVYGSLRSGFKSPAYEYISRYFTLAGVGKVEGALYDMGNYPAGVPGAGSFIIGELYTVNEPAELSWALGQLDDYEGLSTEEGEQQLFRREDVNVFIDGQKVPAWIYWYNGAVEGRPLIPSGDLLEYIRLKSSSQ